MLTKSEKEQQIKGLADHLKKSKAHFFVRFHQLGVQDFTSIRRELKTKTRSQFTVFRNTLMNVILKDQNPEWESEFSDDLKGSNAVVFAFEEPTQVAKLIFSYTKKFGEEKWKIKKGLLDGEVLRAEDVKTLAELPSLEVLQAQFLSVLSAPMSRLLSVFSAPPQAMLRVLGSASKKSVS